MLNRRSLLIGAGALTLNALLAGCSGQQAALRVQMLAGSIPAQLLREFEQQLEQQPKLNIAPEAQLADLFALLQAWKQEAQSDSPPSGFSLPLPLAGKQPVATADLITLGDAWLTAAIQQALIQPLDLDTLSGWQQLPAAWQAVVKRDRQGVPSTEGEIWAAPYRWGTLMIAYRREEFEELGWTPQNWDDLWRSELRGKLSLLESSRAVIGLTLKQLGKSFNEADLEAVDRLEPTLQALQSQVKFYSSDAYLQPLLLGDTWAAVGWSTEILPVLERDPRIAAVVPQSGTALTADLWVRPATASAEGFAASLAAQWINFCWQPEIATQLSIISSAVSPVILTSDRARLPESLQNNSLRLPPTAVIDRSEFLQPLPPATVEQYRQLWLSLRQAV